MRDPSACRRCGVPQRGHLSRWTDEAGWHTYTAPPWELRRARLVARLGRRNDDS